MQGQVKILYGGLDVFSGICPTPFMYFDKNYIDNSSVWGSKYDIKFEGQITGRIGPNSIYDLENKKNKLIELTEDMDLVDEEYDWEKDHNINLIMDGLDRMYRSENEKDRYRAIIILLYYSTGESFTKLGKTLNADRTTISKTFKKGIEILKEVYIKDELDIPTNISKAILDSKLLKEINMKDQGEIYKEWIINNRLIFFNHSLRTREHINEVYKIYNYFMGTNEQPNQCGICVAQKFNYFKDLYFK